MARCADLVNEFLNDLTEAHRSGLLGDAQTRRTFGNRHGLVSLNLAILGVDEFLLVQWIGPITGESPEIILAVLFVFAARPGSGLIALISDKINQWTLLVGALPIAVSVGAGTIMTLPLSARQHEEFFLTSTQSLFGLSLLLRLRLGVGGAIILAALFVVQVGLAYAFQKDQPREIATLTGLAWLYLVLAAGILAKELPRLVDLARRGSRAPNGET